ncbi:MAG: hypothetical protein IJ594_10335, partial [Oscillospiraceae bacterium]|nr:hypothetical protein [Oscillospiraceae bacterium]
MDKRIGERPLTVSDATLERLRRLDAASLHEAIGKRGAVSGEIQALAPGQKLCGRALTVKVYPGDNLMIHRAIHMAGKDDVIVVECGMPNDTSAIGAMMALQAKRNGAAGFLLDGKVVDSEAIVQTGLPVFCSGKAIRGVTKNALGWINCPVS